MQRGTGTTRPLRVLVVEDDDETRLMLREALTDEGFEVLTAQDVRTRCGPSPRAGPTRSSSTSASRM